MYHSITFGDGTLDGSGRFIGKNTWTDWHLLPSSRPVVAQASVTTNFVEIPGRKDGPLDQTEFLTGQVSYGQRSGSFEFIVDNDHEYWETIRMKIANYLHGKEMRMCLEDDPDYYYIGVFTLSNFVSEATNSKLTINYVVAPYKYKITNNQPSL